LCQIKRSSLKPAYIDTKKEESGNPDSSDLNPKTNESFDFKVFKMAIVIKGFFYGGVT
jgi:hypothetical protein